MDILISAGHKFSQEMALGLQTQICQNHFLQKHGCSSCVPTLVRGTVLKFSLQPTSHGCSGYCWGDRFCHFINFPIFDDLVVIHSHSTSLFPQPLNVFACTNPHGVMTPSCLFTPLCSLGIFLLALEAVEFGMWRKDAERENRPLFPGLGNQALLLLLLRSQTHPEALCPSWTKTIIGIEF